MKLLTITRDLQGKRDNDFCFATEGEIAIFGSQCSRATADDNCGCARSMCGIDSKKASTTVKATEVDIDLETLSAKIMHHYIDNWGFDIKQAAAMSTKDAAELIRVAEGFEVGSVIEVRGNSIGTRV